MPGPDGTVLFGMQYQGNPSDALPLVGMIGATGKASLFDAPEPLAPELKGYCADVPLIRAEVWRKHLPARQPDRNMVAPGR